MDKKVLYFTKEGVYKLLLKTSFVRERSTPVFVIMKSNLCSIYSKRN